MTLHRIAYHSVPAPDLTRADIDAILAVAGARNAELGLTGLLLHEFGRFIQVLEGSAEAIETVMGSIAVDRRHSDIHLFLAQSGEARSFGRWAMWSDYRGEVLSAAELREREAIQGAALEALAELQRRS